METKQPLSVVVDLDCKCSHLEGCQCLPSIEEKRTNSVNETPSFSTEFIDQKNGKSPCTCNDPRIALRLSEAVNKFLRKKIRSKKWLRSIFSKEECATKLRFKTRVLLLCNPQPNAKFMQTNDGKKRPRTHRVPRTKRIPKNRRM